MPALGPEFRDTFGLTLAEVGFVFAALAAGVTAGSCRGASLADRTGERPVLSVGLLGTALALVGAALAGHVRRCCSSALFLTGIFGASATGRSGRAIMGWFAARRARLRARHPPDGDPDRRRAGRAHPAGDRARRPASRRALLALAAFARGRGRGGDLDARPRRRRPTPAASTRRRRRATADLAAGHRLRPVRHGRRRRSSASSCSSSSTSTACRPRGGARARGDPGRVSAVARIAIGRWSDRSERRIVPLRDAGLAGAALVAAGPRSPARPGVLVPLLVAGGAAMSSWNGLAFTAAAEIAGRARAGTAMSLQNTLVSVLGDRRSPLFGFLVEPTRGSWRSCPSRRPRPRLVGAAAARGRRGGAARGGPGGALPRTLSDHESATVDTCDVQSGLEGVVAFATEIAEPDKEGGALRYRGVDIEDLVGQVPYEKVWGLLVDGSLRPRPAAGRAAAAAVRSGDPRVDVQSALAMLAPEWGFQPLIDITDEQARDDLARASVMALSFVAQSARGTGQPPVPQSEVDKGTSIPERFLIRWRGEADPDHVKAIDAYWISAAEHGMNASTFTARVVASTGADAAAALSSAVGALSARCTAARRRACSRCSTTSSEMGDAEK